VARVSGDLPRTTTRTPRGSAQPGELIACRRGGRACGRRAPSLPTAPLAGVGINHVCIVTRAAHLALRLTADFTPAFTLLPLGPQGCSMISFWVSTDLATNEILDCPSWRLAYPPRGSLPSHSAASMLRTPHVLFTTTRFSTVSFRLDDAPDFRRCEHRRDPRLLLAEGSYVRGTHAPRVALPAPLLGDTHSDVTTPPIASGALSDT